MRGAGLRPRAGRVSARMTLGRPDSVHLGGILAIMRFFIRASAPRAANVILMDNCPVRLALEREQTPAAFRPWRPSPPPLRRDRSYSSPRSVPRGSAGPAGGPPSVLRDPQEAPGAGRARPQELEEITDGAEPSGVCELFIQGHAGIKDQIELPAPPPPATRPPKSIGIIGGGDAFNHVTVPSPSK